MGSISHARTGGRVVVLCTCLLLPGCKVWLRLFSEGWAPVPSASFTSLTSPAWHLFIYLFIGRKRLLLSQSRRQVSSENHTLPLCTLCFPSSFIVFYVVFLFLYSYGDERVVSWPVVLYLSIYLEGCSIGSMKQELIDIVFTSLVVFLFLCVFLLLIAFGWKGWRLRGGPAKLSQLKLWHYFEQGRLGKVSSAMVLLLAFLYMCLLFVAGVEGLLHKKHEARAHWHCCHFFGCLHYLLLL